MNTFSRVYAAAASDVVLPCERVSLYAVSLLVFSEPFAYVCET